MILFHIPISQGTLFHLTQLCTILMEYKIFVGTSKGMILLHTPIHRGIPFISFHLRPHSIFYYSDGI